MTFRRKLVLGAALSIVTIASAYAAVFTILATGTTPFSEIIGGPATVTFRQLLMDPNEVSGWHYHPGVMISVVKRGSVTVEDGCGGESTFIAGQAFESVGERVHRAKAGPEQLEEYNTFIAPEGMAMTVQVPEKRCGPPKNRRECTNGGWMDFNHPRTFSSQEDCILYVRRGE